MRLKQLSLVAFAVMAVSILAAASTATAGIVLTGGGLAIVEEGGLIDAGNLANGATAFATPCVSGSTSYSIPHINDQTFGHSSSWFAADTTGNSFVGINLGATPQSVGGFAFGGDSNQEYLDNRCTGTFGLQYTTVANPDETTPDSSWTTIGSLNYQWYSPETYFYEPCTCLSTRHRFSFDEVQATGIRLIVPYTYPSDGSNGTSIEEVEVYGTTFAPRGPALTGSLALVEEGGTATGDNLAAASAGAVAFASGTFTAAGADLSNVNDGVYGNDSSWIGWDATHKVASFVGINFDGEKEIDGFAFGRDNDALSGDRYIGEYKLEYTTVADPNAATSDEDWIEIGTLNYSYSPLGGVTNFQDPSVRHRFTFDEVTATGIRLWVPSTAWDVNSRSKKAATAIDELEVYGESIVPEPSSIVMLLVGVFSLMIITRKGE